MENSLSRSGSRSSSVCELEKDFSDIDIMKTRPNRRAVMLRTPPARKAKRIRFFRNGDKFYSGVVIPVLPERYRLVATTLAIYKLSKGDVLIKEFSNFHFHSEVYLFLFICVVNKVTGTSRITQ